jgi:subtilisin family serine protease
VTGGSSGASSASVGPEYEIVAEVGGELEILTVGASDALATAARLDTAGTLLGAGPVVEVRIEETDPVGAPLEVASTATDPMRPQQWGLDVVPVEPLWTCGSGSGVDIAILDTGVDGGHPEFTGRITSGASLLDGATVPGAGLVDTHGHGTHVAGIAAAGASDGVGIAGAAPSATIVPVKVLGANGAGSSDDVARGIRWAADNGADVLNLSLSSPSPSVAMTEAIDYAVGLGSVVVVAAGNGGTSGVTRYPAADDNTIAVGAIDPQGWVAGLSSRGSWVDVAAPGIGILSSIPGGPGIPSGWAMKSGTSMASPYVSGVVASMRSSRGALNQQQVLAALTGTAIDRGALGFDYEYGYGVVDPVGALNAT